ncbi:hypothetical protein ACHHYP_12331 [Achlya hypogyna]|uniref:FYVE-type domain-containing protein n=1 Tax=Achlya hypogyna TaxID=1202772 RepID=A0A1V9ZGV5_ACHHY|nr:hypothetical protein ACHHYP_12331 [Achlya hypogyna]
MSEPQCRLRLRYSDDTVKTRTNNHFQRMLYLLTADLESHNTKLLLKALHYRKRTVFVTDADPSTCFGPLIDDGRGVDAVPLNTLAWTARPTIWSAQTPSDERRTMRKNRVLCRKARSAIELRADFAMLLEGRGVQVRQACPRSQWVRDRDRRTCKGCAKGFTLTRRRHHCRVCGDIVCGGCTTTVYLTNTTSNVGRACLACTSPETPRGAPALPRPTWRLCRSELEATPWHETLAVWHPECAICLESFVAPSDLVLRLPCNHAFHDKCARQWLASHDNCPLCRQLLPQDRTASLSFISF